MVSPAVSPWAKMFKLSPAAGAFSAREAAPSHWRMALLPTKTSTSTAAREASERQRHCFFFPWKGVTLEARTASITLSFSSSGGRAARRGSS